VETESEPVRIIGSQFISFASTIWIEHWLSKELVLKKLKLIAPVEENQISTKGVG